MATKKKTFKLLSDKELMDLALKCEKRQWHTPLEVTSQAVTKIILCRKPRLIVVQYSGGAWYGTNGVRNVSDEFFDELVEICQDATGSVGKFLRATLGSKEGMMACSYRRLDV